MKTAKLISFVVMAGVLFSLILTSCENNADIKSDKDLLPGSFRVAIPSSLTKNAGGGGRTNGRTQADSLQGNDIYQHLGTFIAVGDEASKIVEEIINDIRKYHIDRIQRMTFTGEDDNRTKNLVVVSEATFEGKTWDYQLTITDADSENNADGGKALQVFWNKTSPVKGIAIIKPYNCDRIKNVGAPDAVFRIDYSEGGELGYDAQMEVLISGFPLPSPLNDPYALRTLRMFAGKKGDVVDVFGNSNHPNAILFSGTAGFNWAFVASGNEVKDIAVAEVGLPSSTLDTDDRDVILKEFSVKNVFTHEIHETWPELDPGIIASYLKNTSAPGYFNDQTGFLSGGVSPGAAWDVLAARLDALSPYNPKQTSNLVVEFK